MIYRLRLFGFEVASLELERDDVEPDAIGGGSVHNFERDMEPLDPTPGEEWFGDDRRFGFS